MANTTLDPSLYLHAPQLDVAGSLSLGKAMLAAAPRGASEGVKKSARVLHGAVVTLDKAFTASAPAASLEDMRPLDHTLDGCWGAVRDRLEAFAVLPESSKARGRALAIAAELFPDGTSFLKLNYPSEHAESDKRLAIVKTHAKDLETLVGGEFIDALRKAHTAYGKALGITEAKPGAPAAPNLREPLDALRAAIGKDTVQLLAWADGDGASALQALAPMDQLRALRNRRRSASTATALPPVAPAPTPTQPPA